MEQWVWVGPASLEPAEPKQKEEGKEWYAPGAEGVYVVALQERRRMLPPAGELRHALARLQA